jgi:hypothetical protein
VTDASDSTTFRFTLAVQDAHEIEVRLEPEGLTATLGRDDEFTVELSGRADEPPEIVYSPGVITIWRTTTHALAWNRAGVQLWP